MLRSDSDNSTGERMWDDHSLMDPHAQTDKARRVREMFDHIAPAYQRVNTLASAGRDRAWRRETVRLAGVRPGEQVLDIACGTGNLADAFRSGGAGRVVGVDFAMQMLRRANGRDRMLSWCQGDALRLPFADESFEITSCAFGVRNFQNLTLGFREMHRVLKPGGRALILEFSMPSRAPLKQLYGLYFRQIMPRLATWLSGDRSGAYRYLPRSVLSFETPARLRALLIVAGFQKVTIHRRTCGVVNIFRADK